MNQRLQYRVPAPHDGLRVEVLADTGPTPTRLMDISAGGAALSVPDSHLSGLANGHRLLLRITVPQTSVSFEMKTIVRHIRVGDGRRSFGLQFLQPALLETHLPLFRLCNRRNSFRVPPADREDITLSVMRNSDTLNLQMQLVDISEGGVAGLCLDSRRESLAVQNQVAIKFSLARGRQHLALDGTIRAINSGEYTWRIGMAFAEQSLRASGNRQIIADYVLQRQHEIAGLAS